MCEKAAYSANSGDDGEGEPPVSIPNTEVKPFSADSTWLETTWEGRTSPDFYSSIAQPVEHAAVNRRVVGSSPTWGAKQKGHRFGVPFVCLPPRCPPRTNEPATRERSERAKYRIKKCMHMPQKSYSDSDKFLYA